ncbi:MAG TPA: hypothetical protein VFW45_03970 [Candidatus Polarisedimenticolia bacterium]|nr:hypothetical protein [Candidatus Polarisedimenticolia bacterium]
MLKRPFLLLLSFLFSAPLLVGCNKSEGSKSPNLFGPPPTVSAVSVTKERKHFDCSSSTDLCCVDPPTCSCCCVSDQVNQTSSDLDLVTMTADVADPDGLSDILVVLARFLDPPRDGTPAGTTLNQISLEMFDVGGTAVGTLTIGGTGIPVFTGDVAAGDGTYSRKFYMHTTTGQNLGCIETSDFAAIQGTYSTFGTVSSYAGTTTRNFEYSAQAIDRAGNIDTSAGTVLAIEQSSDVSSFVERACGPPSGAGGCLPGTP